jgi:hypothetical protein
LGKVHGEIVLEVEWTAAVVGIAVGEGDGHHKLLQEEDGGVGTMGEGGGGTDETRGGGGRKIEGEGGPDGDGERHARCVGRNLLTEGGVAAIAITVAATATVRAAARRRS